MPSPTMFDMFCEYDDTALRDITHVLSSNNSSLGNRTISLFAQKINSFIKFLKDELETRRLDDLKPEELNWYLLKYLSKLRKQYTYSKKKWCLRNVFSALAMYLKCLNYSVDITLSETFVQCRSILTRWEGFLGQRIYVTSGKCPAQNLTKQEVKALFDNGIIGIHSPVSLQNFVCVICVCLGVKSGKQLRQINYDHLMVHVDKKRGRKFVKLYCHGHNERRLWQNASDVGRCAVTAVELYKSKRPSTLGNILFPLFVTCNIIYRRYPAAHPVSEDSRWYFPEYIKECSLKDFVKKMMKDAGISPDDKIVTNNSLKVEHVEYFLQSEGPDDPVPTVSYNQEGTAEVKDTIPPVTNTTPNSTSSSSPVPVRLPCTSLKSPALTSTPLTSTPLTPQPLNSHTITLQTLALPSSTPTPPTTKSMISTIQSSPGPALTKRPLKSSPILPKSRSATSPSLAAHHASSVPSPTLNSSTTSSSLNSELYSVEPKVEVIKGLRSCTQYPSHQFSVTQPNISLSRDLTEEIPTVRLADLQTNIPILQRTREQLTQNTTFLPSDPVQPPPASSFLELLNTPSQNQSALYDSNQPSPVPLAILPPDYATISEHCRVPSEIVAQPIQKCSSSVIPHRERSSSIRKFLEPLPKVHHRPYPFNRPSLTNDKNRQNYPDQCPGKGSLCHENGNITPQTVLETGTQAPDLALNLVANSCGIQTNTACQLESPQFSSLPSVPPIYQNTSPTLIDMLQSPLQVYNQITSNHLLPNSLPQYPAFNTSSSLSFTTYEDRSSGKSTSIPVYSQRLVPTITTTYFNHYTNSYWYHNERASNITKGTQTDSSNNIYTCSTQTDFNNPAYSSQAEYKNPTFSSITQTSYITVDPLLTKGTQCCLVDQTESQGHTADSVNPTSSPVSSPTIRTIIPPVASNGLHQSPIRAYKATITNALHSDSSSQTQLPLMDTPSKVLLTKDTARLTDSQQLFHLFPIESAHAFIQRNGTREIAIQKARIKELYIQPRPEQSRECTGNNN